MKELYSEYLGVDAPIVQRLKKQPWGAEDFIVRDPDGNLVHFAQSIELREAGHGGSGNGLSSQIGGPRHTREERPSRTKLT